MNPTETQRKIVRNLGRQIVRHAEDADMDLRTAIAQLESTAAMLRADAGITQPHTDPP